MTLDEVRSRSLAEWQALQSGERPAIFIGTATCGRAAGALDTLHAFETQLSRRGLEADIVQVGCLGLCYLEPLVFIVKAGWPRICFGKVTPDLVGRLVEGFLQGDDPCLELALGTLEGGEEGGRAAHIPELSRFDHEHRLVLRRCGLIDPENAGHFLAQGGYRGLEKALQMAPADVVQQVHLAGLRGRGGAGFDTGRKWQLCREAPGAPKYIICNADEGDPGAFMDRVVLESDPHQVIEGMIIAGFAIGAAAGYIYTRAEYPLAIARLRIALKQAQELGVLGRAVLGSGFDFEISLVQGAGAFVCGEETALIASLEGRRGMPRPRPPFPAEQGLWGKPTVVDNVKTLAAVPVILDEGAESFARIGSDGSKGTAMFALAGKINNTGLVEVPMGTTLRRLVFDIGEGVRGGKTFKAVQIGGPSGGCLPESLLDTPVDFDSLTAAGAMMGSGGMIVLDQDNCMVDAARYFLDFTQKESCGKCTMCRLGTQQMLLILEDIVAGRGREEDLALLTELAEDVKEGSLCGLGRTAPNPVLTTLRYFRDEYEAHIKEKRCPALLCKDLIVYYIKPDKCERSCEHCKLVCPTKAITGEMGQVKVIEQDKCVKCSTCLLVCPPQYDAIVKLSPVTTLPAGAEPSPGK